jgi:mannose-6-phosphate isomerase-like protein (cupin superfamily)
MMMLESKVIDNSQSKEYYFKEGCFVLELSNSDLDEEVSIAKIRVEVATQTKWHSLVGTTERYLIVEGKGLVEIGDKTQEVKAGDVVLIPAECRQRIKNIGDNELIFYAICSPRFKSDNYREF